MCVCVYIYIYIYIDIVFALGGTRDQSLSRSDPRLFVPGVGKDSFEQTADAQRIQALPCYSFCHIRTGNLYIATLYEEAATMTNIRISTRINVIAQVMLDGRLTANYRGLSEYRDHFSWGGPSYKYGITGP